MTRLIPLARLFIPLVLSLFHASSISARAETMQLTPVIDQVLADPVEPVLGSDGEYHLVYELQLTNVSPLPWHVDQLQALGNGKVLAELKTAELKSRMGPL
ncbi:MAG: hypothetical protein K8R69_08250, partial [Deltaproteobacteria bacterium]|nr:hypothetical protein [Deltaproteobacteria bacterium]